MAKQFKTNCPSVRGKEKIAETPQMGTDELGPKGQEEFPGGGRILSEI